MYYKSIIIFKQTGCLIPISQRTNLKYNLITFRGIRRIEHLRNLSYLEILNKILLNLFNQITALYPVFYYH